MEQPEVVLEKKRERKRYLPWAENRIERES